MTPTDKTFYCLLLKKSTEYNKCFIRVLIFQKSWSKSSFQCQIHSKDFQWYFQWETNLIFPHRHCYVNFFISHFSLIKLKSFLFLPMTYFYANNKRNTYFFQYIICIFILYWMKRKIFKITFDCKWDSKNVIQVQMLFKL